MKIYKVAIQAGHGQVPGQCDDFIRRPLDLLTKFEAKEKKLFSIMIPLAMSSAVVID